MPRRKKWSSRDSFLAVAHPMIEVPGGSLWRLARDAGSDAVVLLLMALVRADFRTPDGTGNRGGVRGPRTLPYSVIRTALGWHTRRIRRALDALVARGWLITDPSVGTGIRPATVYRIGAAHPWAPRPTSTGGCDAESTPGCGDAPDGSPPNPPVDTRADRARTRFPGGVCERIGRCVADPGPTSTPGHGSRSTTTTEKKRKNKKREKTRGLTNDDPGGSRASGVGRSPHDGRPGDVGSIMMALVGRRVGRPVDPGEVAAVAVRLGLGAPSLWTTADIHRLAEDLRGDAGVQRAVR